MADANERKSPEEIKEKILDALNNKPLNAQEISKAISSNWSTVQIYVSELVREGKIRRIVFMENVYYQKIIEDTYFNIPIKEKDRETLKFIFSNAMEKYKEMTGKPIRKTELAKLSAEINTQLNLGLPIVWYIYGPMPLMKIEFQRDYTPKSEPKDATEIKKAIHSWIKNNTRNLIRELRVEFYQKSKNQVYFIKEKIYNELERGKYNNISDLVYELLTAVISYDRKFEEIMIDFWMITPGANYIKMFENKKFQNKFLLAFDSLWKYLASNMLFESLIRLGYPKEETELLLGPTIETKSYFAQDTLHELKETYFENMPEKVTPPKLSLIDGEARKIIDQWMESGVWRY